MTDFSIIAWNVYEKHDPRHVRSELRSMIEAESPDMFVLTEAKNMCGRLEGLGYQVVQYASKPRRRDHAPETGNVALLVRDGLKINYKAALWMRLTWRGPKVGKKHDPRVYQWLKVTKAKTVFKVGGFHLPFGDEQKAESDKAIRAWLKRTVKGRPVIAIGDMNMKVGGAYARIARHARALVDGFGIDLAIFKNCRLVRKKNLGKRGSDHPAALFVFRK